MTDLKGRSGFIIFFRKSLILSFAGCIFSLAARSQEKEEHRPNHDNWPYYFGMSVSYNSSTLHSTKHPLFLQNDSVLAVEPGSSGGIALGLVGTLQLSPRFSLRANPQLIIGGAKYFTYSLKYPTFDEKSIEKKTLPSNIVSFPFQVKFNSDRITNFRTYMMAGVKYDIDLASNSQARNAEDLVKLKKNDFGIEAGVGFNFFFRFVTFSPEIKISNGLTNIHSRDANLKFSNVLDKLHSRMVVFSIILED
ncbi:outer membrane beta-barrel protein [Segetibacter koreensis]|uniref:type IX secretion/gliding motility protein PorT/SprT n=1 Tax=Segetibacter koreensis TaxID=398037 RepID=UPI0003615D56|nr:outer membrane beta-barrel protein [Segetibacter koreensis]